MPALVSPGFGKVSRSWGKRRWGGFGVGGFESTYVLHLVAKVFDTYSSQVTDGAGDGGHLLLCGRMTKVEKIFKLCEGRWKRMGAPSCQYSWWLLFGD